MKNNLNNDPNPAVFKVIGCDNSTSDIINMVNELNYNGVQASVISDDAPITPAIDDLMAIFICGNGNDGVEELVKSYYQTGVLTLVISTSTPTLSEYFYDSLTSTSHENVVNVIKTLLNPIFYPGRLSYDFNDLATTLRNTKNFSVINGYGQGESRMADAVAELREQLNPDDPIEHLNMIIHYNENLLDPQLAMCELNAISEFIRDFPKEVDIIWTVHNNSDLDNATIGLAAIAAGPKLNLNR